MARCVPSPRETSPASTSARTSRTPSAPPNSVAASVFFLPLTQYPLRLWMGEFFRGSLVRFMHSQRSRSLYLILISILLLIVLFVGCSHKPTDVEIASEVQNKINADPNIPTKQISVGNS